MWLVWGRRIKSTMPLAKALSHMPTETKHGTFGVSKCTSVFFFSTNVEKV